MEIKLIVEGGKMQPGPAVAQQLGPIGVNIGKVIEDVNKETTGFKGMKVPVILNVNPKTKECTITVSSPPVAELIKKELKIEKGSGEPGKVKMGNVAIETLIGIAQMKQSSLLVRELRGALREVVGTCASLGVFIESKEPNEIQIEIEAGTYDKEIEGITTEVSPDKRKKLDSFFASIKTQQDKAAKVKEEEKAAAEAKKTEEATKAAPTAETEDTKKDEKKDDKKKK